MRCVIFVNLLILRDSKIWMLLEFSNFSFHLSSMDSNILVSAVDLFLLLLLYTNYFSLNLHKNIFERLQYLLFSLLKLFHTSTFRYFIILVNLFFWVAMLRTLDLCLDPFHWSLQLNMLPCQKSTCRFWSSTILNFYLVILYIF